MAGGKGGWLPTPAGGSAIAVKDAGATVGTRGGINFIEGSNVTLTIADDAANNEVDVTITAALSGAGILLASHSYNPASVTTVNSTSGTFADIDGTNVAITFTAPASGTVLVRATILGDNGGGSTTWSLNLRTAAGDVANTARDAVFGGSRNVIVVSPVWKLTGLTSGASYTYKLGHARTFGGSTTAAKYGGSSGPAVLEVWSA